METNLRQSLNNKDYDGQDYVVDKDLRLAGPLKKRKCTDCLFVLLFFAFITAWGIATAYGVRNGKPEELVNPNDQDGNICGVGNLIDYPNLYYLIKLDAIIGVNDFSYSEHAICLKECPAEEDTVLDCAATTYITKENCQSRFDP